MSQVLLLEIITHRVMVIVQHLIRLVVVEAVVIHRVLAAVAEVVVNSLQVWYVFNKNSKEKL